MRRKETKTENVVIKGQDMARFGVRLVGTAPLIQNNFSQKAMEQMLAKHMGRSVEREKKVPRQVIEDAKVLNIKNEVVLLTTAIKKSVVGIAPSLKGVAKTQLNYSFFVVGQTIPLEYEEMVPRWDVVRTSGLARTPDIRFRPQFNNWSANIVVKYDASLLSLDLVLNLLQRSGNSGLCEWRPQKGGSFGTYTLDSESVTQDVRVMNDIERRCMVPLKTPTIPVWALDAEIDPSMLAKLANPDTAVDTSDVEEIGESGVGEPPPVMNGRGKSNGHARA